MPYVRSEVQEFRIACENDDKRVVQNGTRTNVKAVVNSAHTRDKSSLLAEFCAKAFRPLLMKSERLM